MKTIFFCMSLILSTQHCLVTRMDTVGGGGQFEDEEKLGVGHHLEDFLPSYMFVDINWGQ